MPLPYPNKDAVPFTPLTAQFVDEMIANDEYLGDILDGVSPTGPDGWNFLSALNPTVTANGNRSYDLVYASTNYTNLVNPGMRLKLTRTVTAPTQCADLESGSSQYFSKTSPAGTTFTDDFCAGGWVKLESYAQMGVISRWNGTSGWVLKVNTGGTVQMFGTNAGAANSSYVVSWQSLELGRWYHIAAQLDMSAFTATTTTSYIMIDGVDVPATVARAGTNPTALIQAGNLEVGSFNATSTFDGKLSNVWYSSAKITQANIRTLMSQSITSAQCTTHSIVSAFTLNNTLNDVNTTSANNLTAQGGALATNSDSPFGIQADGTTAGTTEYAIITKTAFSTNTTLTVQVPEGNAIPTSGGVSAVSYSAHKAPYGFPAARSKWQVTSMHYADTTTTYAAGGTYYNHAGRQLIVPVGEWTLSHQYVLQNDGTVSAAMAMRAAVGTSTSDLLLDLTDRNIIPAATTIELSGNKMTQLSLAAATTYLAYVQFESGGGTGTSRYIGAAIVGRNTLTAELALL